MGKDNEQKNRLMKRAVSTDNLLTRATSNQLYAENDFNGWVKELFEKLSFSSVLDVCCGTGNQLVLYAVMPEVSYVAGVDISQESLDVAKNRVLEINRDTHLAIKPIRIEEMFFDPDLNNRRFDLISCFYGLYYADDAKKLLCEMVEHLSSDGSILIVGPYGDNNANLFYLLERYFEVPELAKRSASTFMEKEVIPILSEDCLVESNIFKNVIRYPNAKAVADYWRSSTFYSPEHEDLVIKDMEEYCALHDEFVIEKHVMACIARRRSWKRKY